MEPCEQIIGQSAQFQPLACGMPGIRVGEVVRCKACWAHSRERTSRRAPNDNHNRGRSYRNYLNEEQ